MHLRVQNLAVFSAAALLTLPYVHSVSLQLRGEGEICPKKRAICSSTLINLVPISLRRMGLPEDADYPDSSSLDVFMRSRTNAAPNAATHETTGTAVYSVLGEEPVSWAVKEMCGCSALIVVSEKAVYVTHYFEDLAFCGTNDRPANLKREILDPLEHGALNHRSLAGHAVDFRDQAGLAAFIMTPTKEDSGALQYEGSIRKLKDKVNSLIGMVPTVIPYKAEDCDYSRELGTNALGTGLFQYDPQRQGNRSQKLAKVWIERKEVYSHAWSTNVADTSPAEEPLPVVKQSSTPIDVVPSDLLSESQHYPAPIGHFPKHPQKNSRIEGQAVLEEVRQ